MASLAFAGRMSTRLHAVGHVKKFDKLKVGLGAKNTYHVQGLYWDISTYLEDFPADSKWCNIIYENGERSFTIEIPLPQKEGEA